MKTGTEDGMKKKSRAITLTLGLTLA